MRGRSRAGAQRRAAMLLVCLLFPLLAACGGSSGLEAGATQLPAPAATSAEISPTSVPATTVPTQAATDSPPATDTPPVAETTAPAETVQVPTEPPAVTVTDEPAPTTEAATTTPGEAIRPQFGVVTHLY